MKKTLALWLATTLAVGCGDDDDKSSGPDTDAAREETPRDAALPDAAKPDADAAKPEVAKSDASADVPDAMEGVGEGVGDGGHDGGRDGGRDAGGLSIEPPCDASKAPAIPALALEAVEGLDSLPRLVDAAQPPGSSDWYLVQQTGVVRVLRRGALLPGNFIDVTDEITIANDMEERGLLGIAFPPDYATSGKLYVAMTATKGANASQDMVYEYTRAEDGKSAGQRKEIVKLASSAGNHNGGNLQFGPDGFLYFGTGDGGDGCGSNKPGAAQDPAQLYGKILRLDLRAPAPYAAAGNPFSGSTGDARVLHYGLRNPFRFGFDRYKGDLFIGDVGQDKYEEVDLAPAGSKGLNFGWPALEGDHTDHCSGVPGRELHAGSTPTKPIVDIVRKSNSPFADYVSVIGGVVYRGNAIPSLRGVYLFGDYQGARMGALKQCGSATSAVTPIAKNKDPNEPAQAGFTRPAGAGAFQLLTSIVEDDAGELYFVVNRSTLWKVVPSP